ncbi:MAG TPA: hypothetical protein DCX07_06075 [Phycisphaerales bacterium]|nr:hypothetical protein [Phycisphaerales bacterium]
MIHNPILRKEVLTALRTRKALAMQILFLLGTAVLIWLLWDPRGFQDLAGMEVRRILTVLAIGQLVMVALFSPAFTAAAITSEREHRTLESLLASRMKPWEIALGKMAGSLTFILLLVLSGAPALAAVFLLGGVSGAEVLAVEAILLLTAVYLGMFGLLVSTFMHRSYRAIIVTYAILLVVCLSAVVAWPISDHMILRGGAAWQGVLHTIASLSPLEAMLSVVQPNSTYCVGAQSMPPFWKMYIPLAVLIGAVTTLACLYRLHRPIAPPRPRERLKVVERGKMSARRFFFLIDPRMRKNMIRWWQNPVAIKEFRTRPMLQSHWLLRAIAVCLIVSVLLMFVVSLSVAALTGGRSNEDPTLLYPMMATAVAALMVIVLVLIGPAMTGGALCGDRETGVWDLMRTTRLSGWTIVVGKFEASIIPLLLLTMAMAPAMLILLYFNANLWVNILRVFQVAGMTILFVGTAGMFFSSIFPRTSTATAWTYGLVVSIALVSLLVLLAQNLFSQQFVRSVYILNPVAAAMDAAGYPAIQKLDLVPSHLRIFGVTTAVMFVVSVVRVMQMRRAS